MSVVEKKYYQSLPLFKKMCGSAFLQQTICLHLEKQSPVPPHQEHIYSVVVT